MGARVNALQVRLDARIVIAPAGKEPNWIQTIPGKGWNVILRFYGPLEPWFDQTWRPGEIELVE